MRSVVSVLKLDGHTQGFQILRLAESIYRAGDSRGRGNFHFALELAGGVAHLLGQQHGCAERLPTQTIREAVEDVLATMRHVVVANAYVEYPVDRAMRLAELQVQHAVLLPEATNAAQLILGFPEPVEQNGWDRLRLIRSVMREYGVGKNVARRVAKQVENRFLRSTFTEIPVGQLEAWREEAVEGFGSKV